MRRLVRCYNGPRDGERITVDRNPPSEFYVPEPMPMYFTPADDPAWAEPARVGTYHLDTRMTNKRPGQLFDFPTERAYRWMGYR